MKVKRTLTILTVAVVLVCLVNQLYGETVYFLVAEPNRIFHGDSYVLPLTEPNDIAYARDLIKYGIAVDLPIVVAHIDCNSDCINRDYLAPAKPVWSWHVTQFDYFADATPEIYDGWPGYVDSNCKDVPKTIGFWSYTVTAELGTDPYHWLRDFYDNNDIDFLDYALIGSNWNNNCVSPGWCGGTDLDHNGEVDYVDLMIFAEAWLSPYASPPVNFACWSWPYQCYGDADNATQSNYRVYSNDAAIFAACKAECMSMGGGGWPCHYPDKGYDPRCDFNRDYKIYDDDAAILTANYKKKDSNFPTTCPPKTNCLGN